MIYILVYIEIPNSWFSSSRIHDFRSSQTCQKCHFAGTYLRKWYFTCFWCFWCFSDIWVFWVIEDHVWFWTFWFRVGGWWNLGKIVFFTILLFLLFLTFLMVFDGFWWFLRCFEGVLRGLIWFWGDSHCPLYVIWSI